MNDPNPVTYRELHEHCAGYGLEPTFFAISGINPDALVTCNCRWDEGHEPHCDMVLANKRIHASATAHGEAGKEQG